MEPSLNQKLPPADYPSGLHQLGLRRWDDWNQLLVSLSIFAFLPLQLPQIFKNYQLIASGDPAQIATMSIIPVMGYASGMIANLLLMSFLSEQRELLGAIVQAIGVITSGIVLSQLFYVDMVPSELYIPLVSVMVVGLVFNGFSFILGNVKGFILLWNYLKNGLNTGGLAVLPLLLSLQIARSFGTDVPLWPGEIVSGAFVGSAGLGLVQQRVGRLTQLAESQAGLAYGLLATADALADGMAQNWPKVSGWTANFLFMFGPAAQLVNNLTHPGNIGGLSLGTQLLSVAGNLLMLGRSGTLLVGRYDRIWAFGGIWDVSFQTFTFLTMVGYGSFPLPGYVIYLGVSFSYVSTVYGFAKRDYPDATVGKTLHFLVTGKRV